ncbi:MAG: response regulator transcription factor [Proteobacteria bacterium]|nr:response regulator transcription factor [Pseudomonadota bacterium]MBK8958279.1 response regulator transcription factor [Pseudomonadota bacterium]
MKVLLVEDSPILRDSLAEHLRAQGASVDAAEDGAQALAYLASYSYDIVILDLMLPKVDGMRVLRDMRAAGATSRVLVLSARDEIADRVEALNLGADDYLVKPFAQAELESRLQALMRRSLEAPQPQLSVAGLRVDPARRLASVDGRALALSPKEFALLEALLRQRGTVLTRGRLFELLYDSRSEASDKVIEVLVSTLRAKLAQAGVADVIQTRRGFGYVIDSP